ncbi:hypothetical protein [Halorarius halobius]|uniref:hypothetical protein n=1 Tax=Halorarius halobius TaxID=2962671 RepID=UPI0020CDD7A1|nr:hypothetical protein [Halorarius halobius]
MQHEQFGRAAVAVALAVLLVAAALVPAAAVAAQEDTTVADGHTGSVDEGREDNEQQKYPLNYTFFPVDRQPGNVDGEAKHFAVGLTEDIRLHWIVVTSPDFGFGNCEPSDTNAFGIDRGNDNEGTQTDESLLTSYKSYNSKPNAIQIAYYKEDALAGGPVRINVEDQIVAAQTACYDNPEQSGWYRVDGMINGSTKMDTQTDYTIQAATQWIYVCDCSSREEARQTLGPPPGADSGSSGGSSTPDSTATPSATATPTPTPDAGSSTTPASSDTPTPQRSTATPADEPAAGGGGGDGGSDSGGSDDGSTGGAARTATQQRADADRPARRTTTDGSVPVTPTVAEGPGFGTLLALVALVGAGLVVLGRR